MIDIDIPGFGASSITDAVFDFNGTIAEEGELIPGVTEELSELSLKINIHVITADTYGTVKKMLPDFISLHILSSEDHIAEKANYVRSLGSDSCIAVGNGRNDRMMLEEAWIGIAVIQKEGSAMQALMAADIVVKSIHDAIALMNFPSRMKATLRG